MIATRPPTPCVRNLVMGAHALTAEAATTVFLAKRHLKNGLLQLLATEFSISTKAVRDIWELRTWSRTTEPYWTPEEGAKYIDKHAKAAANKRRAGQRVELTSAQPSRDNVKTPTALELHLDLSLPSIYVAATSPQSPFGPVEDTRIEQIVSTESPWIIETAFVAQDFEALNKEWEQIQSLLVRGQGEAATQ